MTAFRALLRLAGRDALRHKGRSFLIVLTLAFPVAGLVAAATLIHALSVPATTKVTWQLGQADAQVTEAGDRFLAADGPALATAALAPRLPAGSEAVGYRVGFSRVTSAGQLLRQLDDVSDLPYDAPIARGMVHPLQGHAPTVDDQVTVSRHLADEDHLRLGSQVTLIDLSARPLTVVGIAENPDGITDDVAWTSPGTITDKDSQPPRVLVRVPAGGDLSTLKATSSDESIDLRTDLLAQHPSLPIAGNSQIGLTVLVAGLALLEAILMAGAAFAVGARRSQRDLALVGATGGDAGQIRSIVLLGGVTLGLVGGVVGAFVGLGVAEALLPYAPRLSGHIYAGTHPRPLELVGAAAVGIVTGLVSAWLPARGAARAPILSSLTGRRGVVRSSAPLTGLAIATAVVGTLIAAWAGRTSRLGGQQINAVLLGAAVAELGFAGCAPALVGFAGRFAGRLPLTARLSLRDIARHRNRTGPAVAAIMATLSGVVAMGVYVASSNARSQADYQPQLPATMVTLQSADSKPVDPSVLAAVRASLPVIGVSTYSTPSSSTFLSVDDVAEGGSVLVGSPGLMTALGHPEAAAALARGELVVLAKGSGTSGSRHVTLHKGDNDVTSSATLPSLTIDVPSYANLGTAFVSQAVADRLGLAPMSPATALNLSRKPSSQQIDAAKAVLLAYHSPSSPSSVYLDHETGLDDSKSLLVPLALLAISTLVTFGVTAISTALSAAESKGDFATLSAVGATPFVRRRLAMGQAAVLALLGGVLGILAGLVPMTAVIAVRSDALTFTVPWQVIALALVGVPALAAAGAGLFTRSKLPLARRLT